MAWYDYNSKFYNISAIILAGVFAYYAFKNSPETSSGPAAVDTMKGRYEIVYDPDKPMSEYSWTERAVLYFAKDKIDQAKQKSQEMKDRARPIPHGPKIEDQAIVEAIITKLEDQTKQKVTLVIGNHALQDPFIEISAALITHQAGETVTVPTKAHGTYNVEIMDVRVPKMQESEIKDDNKPN